MHCLTLLEKVRQRIVQHAIRKIPLSCLDDPYARFMRDDIVR